MKLASLIETFATDAWRSVHKDNLEPVGDMWSTSSKRYARQIHGKHGNVSKVKIDITRPLDLRMLGTYATEANINRVLTRAGLPPISLGGETGVNIYSLVNGSEGLPDIRDAMRQAGYDGAILQELELDAQGPEETTTSYVKLGGTK